MLRLQNQISRHVFNEETLRLESREKRVLRTSLAKAMAGAAMKVEAVYQAPFLAHATMEPMNCTVHVRQDGCDVWVDRSNDARLQAGDAAPMAASPLTSISMPKIWRPAAPGLSSSYSPTRRALAIFFAT